MAFQSPGERNEQIPTTPAEKIVPRKNEALREVPGTGEDSASTLVWATVFSFSAEDLGDESCEMGDMANE